MSLNNISYNYQLPERITCNPFIDEKSNHRFIEYLEAWPLVIHESTKLKNLNVRWLDNDISCLQQKYDAICSLIKMTIAPDTVSTLYKQCVYSFIEKYNDIENITLDIDGLEHEALLEQLNEMYQNTSQTADPFELFDQLENELFELISDSNPIRILFQLFELKDKISSLTHIEKKGNLQNNLIIPFQECTQKFNDYLRVLKDSSKTPFWRHLNIDIDSLLIKIDVILTDKIQPLAAKPLNILIIEEGSSSNDPFNPPKLNKQAQTVRNALEKPSLGFMKHIPQNIISGLDEVSKILSQYDAFVDKYQGSSHSKINNLTQDEILLIKNNFPDTVLTPTALKREREEEKENFRKNRLKKLENSVSPYLIQLWDEMTHFKEIPEMILEIFDFTYKSNREFPSTFDALVELNNPKRLRQLKFSVEPGEIIMPQQIGWYEQIFIRYRNMHLRQLDLLKIWDQKIVEKSFLLIAKLLPDPKDWERLPEICKNPEELSCTDLTYCAMKGTAEDGRRFIAFKFPETEKPIIIEQADEKGVEWLIHAEEQDNESSIINQNGIPSCIYSSWQNIIRDFMKKNDPFYKTKQRIFRSMKSLITSK